MTKGAQLPKFGGIDIGLKGANGGKEPLPPAEGALEPDGGLDPPAGLLVPSPESDRREGASEPSIGGIENGALEPDGGILNGDILSALGIELGLRTGDGPGKLNGGWLDPS